MPFVPIWVIQLICVLHFKKNPLNKPMQLEDFQACLRGGMIFMHKHTIRNKHSEFGEPNESIGDYSEPSGVSSIKEILHNLR